MNSVWKIMGFGLIGTSIFFSELTAQTMPFLKAATASDNSIHLLWDYRANSSAIRFFIDRADYDTPDQKQNPIFVNIAERNNNSPFVFVDSGISIRPGREFLYLVRAEVFSNEGGGITQIFSPTVHIKVKKDLPSSPSRPQVQVIKPGEIVLTWDKQEVFNETGFAVERAAGSPQNFEVVHLAPAQSSLFVDRELDSNQKYFYRIRSLNGFGASKFTKIVSVMPSALPVSPSILVAKSIGRSISLKWNAHQSIPVTNFRIDRTIDSPMLPFSPFDLHMTQSEMRELINRLQSNRFQTIARVPGDQNSYLDTVVDPQMNYVYRIYAENNAGNSRDPSNEVSVIADIESADADPVLPPLPPTPPENFSKTPLINKEKSKASFKRVFIEWSAPNEGEEGFILEREEPLNNRGFRIIKNLTKESVNFLDHEIISGNLYRYRISACKGSACSPYSEDVTIATPQVVLPPMPPMPPVPPVKSKAK